MSLPGPSFHSSRQASWKSAAEMVPSPSTSNWSKTARNSSSLSSAAASNRLNKLSHTSSLHRTLHTPLNISLNSLSITCAANGFKSCAVNPRSSSADSESSCRPRSVVWPVLSIRASNSNDSSEGTVATPCGGFRNAGTIGCWSFASKSSTATAAASRNTVSFCRAASSSCIARASSASSSAAWLCREAARLRSSLSCCLRVFWTFSDCVTFLVILSRCSGCSR
mmetsp:Transcript_37036/g.83832  ORF Transcript_37036/g.83832 Transcript_37036/m.83832 type:complete len:224 (+) Transcript_37036:647-1318(+)